MTFFPDNLDAGGDYERELRGLGIELIHGNVKSFDAHVRERRDEYDLVLLSRLRVANRHSFDVARQALLRITARRDRGHRIVA